MTTPNGPRRVIEVHQPIAGSLARRERTLRTTKLSDYGHVAAVYRDVAKKLSSPLLMGPPICDELMAFVQHLFTEEEASVVRHLGVVRGRTAAAVAKAEHLPRERAEAILHGVAFEKRAIACSGRGPRKVYRLIPVVPGIFEMVLIGQSLETISDWHRRFAELFEALFDTGYGVDYQLRRNALVRFLPVGRAIEAHPMALPSDRLEVVLDRYEVFGIGQCQCRMSAAVVGHGCGRPLGNCTAMGQWAERGIAEGWLRSASRKEVLEAKREAESHGLATWIMNVEAAKGQCSCSCCGCCCKAMRAVTDFNAPGAMAPPHFLPQFDAAKCTYCGKCAQRCPLKAIVLDAPAKTWRHLIERCVGCGLCVVACEKRRALRMEPVPDYRLPYKSWFSLLTHEGPTMLKASWNVWRKR